METASFWPLTDRQTDRQTEDWRSPYRSGAGAAASHSGVAPTRLVDPVRSDGFAPLTPINFRNCRAGHLTEEFTTTTPENYA